MDDDLIRPLERWHDAEADARDDDADAACRALFASVADEPVVALDFTARTLTAIDEALAADRRRARALRRVTGWGSVAAVAVALYLGGGWLLHAFTAAMVGTIDLIVALTVRIANGMDTGATLWGVVASLGRAVASFVSDPTVTFVIIAAQGLAMAALVALQRLLGSDRESFK